MKIFCFLKEVLRIATQLPVWLLHRTTRDVIIDGYKLPKGTAVAPQIIAVHMDEEVLYK